MSDDESGRVIEAEFAEAAGDGSGVVRGPVAMVGSRRGAEAEKVRDDEAMVLGKDVEGAAPVSARGEQSVEEHDRWARIPEPAHMEVGVVFAGA